MPTFPWNCPEVDHFPKIDWFFKGSELDFCLIFIFVARCRGRKNITKIKMQKELLRNKVHGDNKV